jgi:polyferredoxin
MTEGFFRTDLTKKECSDTGMAMTLIALLLGFFTENIVFYKIGIPVLLMNMIWPQFFYPLGIVWFGLSKALGTVVSKILLTIVFTIIVLPVSIFRRLIGKDSLQLKNWKKGRESVMRERKHVYSSNDLVKPY